MSDFVEWSEALTEAVYRLPNTKCRLRENVVLDPAHVARLLHVADRGGVCEADATLAQVRQDTAVCALEVNAELLIGASYGRREVTSADDSLLRRSRDGGLYLWSSVREKVKIWSFAYSAIPVGALNGNDALGNGFNVLVLLELGLVRLEGGIYDGKCAAVQNVATAGNSPRGAEERNRLLVRALGDGVHLLGVLKSRPLGHKPHTCSYASAIDSVAAGARSYHRGTSSCYRCL